jgi:hypothetical protein
MKANLFIVHKGRAARAWASRVVLAAYCSYVLLSWWSQLTDLETTVRLVGSDVGCSLSVINCNWISFAIDKIVGLAILAATIGALFLPNRRRDKTLNVAAVLAAVHLIALWWSFNPT